MSEPTLTDAFAALGESTTDFHERFETRKHITLADQWARVVEEFHEVETEIEAVQNGADSTFGLPEEIADLLVTLLGAAWFAGLSNQHLAAAMLEVAEKNNRKTPENCTWVDGKVTRKSKLGQGDGLDT